MVSALGSEGGFQVRNHWRSAVYVGLVHAKSYIVGQTSSVYVGLVHVKSYVVGQTSPVYVGFLHVKSYLIWKYSCKKIISNGLLQPDGNFPAECLSIATEVARPSFKNL
ncbi:hypothetical protein AVEN_237863-1 [Araneus ventricosus]|uniref:Uncharacterized protein n=1 Tax=Araneus ventricosus TaxID=182803 RepID=A0A4Y2W4N8_ARAVE|nr:hypothetical protein AVEN_237863-1 [Araneus ventricosus]